jgi:hypothetical protein
MVKWWSGGVKILNACLADADVSRRSQLMENGCEV